MMAHRHLYQEVRDAQLKGHHTRAEPAMSASHR